MFADRSPWVVAAFGLFGLAAVALLAAAVGAVAISPMDVVAVILDHVTPATLDTPDVADSIVWSIRLPRILAAAGAGAALGLAGTVLQGSYRNPFADPHLVGISAVGSIGVLLGAWALWDIWGPAGAVIGGAVAGAVGSAAVRFIAARVEGDPTHLIVVGIGFGLAVSAVVSAAAIAIHDPRIPDTEFWFVGGLGASTWGTAFWVSVCALTAVAVTIPFARHLDLLSLGAAPALHLGVDVGWVLAATLSVSGLAVGASVGAAGVIGFVGLVASYAARRLVGEHHRLTLVASPLLGAAFLIACDAGGRVLGGRFEVPVGLITAAIGGPFLIWVVVRRAAS